MIPEVDEQPSTPADVDVTPLRSITWSLALLFTTCCGATALFVSDELGAGRSDAVPGMLVFGVGSAIILLSLSLLIDARHWSLRQFLRDALLGRPEGPRWVRMPAWSWWTLVVVAWTVISLGFGHLVLRATPPPLPEEIVANAERSATTGGVALQVVHAAAEEAVFRSLIVGFGLAVALLVSCRWGRRAVLAMVILVSGVAFGLLHQAHGMTNVISAGVSGVVYAWMVVLSRSLWPAIAAHAGFNVIVLSPLMMV